ncbi:MAG: tRNA (adenosine(37)-N6)-dimethylallyltransferase MiaA [Marinosulfonomonas sp.]|nr:MAG: tRNA (adenosine(37)-N6)-dimethylallyltransferase MiaA [Marinosulfonomonas sp.]
MIDIKSIPADLPVLIAGPTAAGKSMLALKIADTSGGVIVNADALQVFDGWRILTARPDDHDLGLAEHLLYGHVPFNRDYSVGRWLRDVAQILDKSPDRPIIVGGTGLYFKALTEGLANIPATPPEIRMRADQLLADHGLDALLIGLDPATLARIDRKNPVRVQRAWEVQQATGRSLAAWQDITPPPLLPLEQCTPIVLNAERDWLNTRIDRRFDLMLKGGALKEARAMEPHWNPAHLSAKAIGAPQLIAHIRGEITLDQARDGARIASHQYAKRQRTWFRARMGGWHPLRLP